MCIAGSYMRLSNLAMFTDDMTAGSDFIAFAAIIFGSGNIPTFTLVSLMYGYTGSMAIRLEGLGIRPQIIEMISYLFTIIILILSIFRPNHKGKVKKAKAGA